jgi:hypothetical protein
MSRFMAITGELAKFFFVSVPLAIMVYIVIHIGFVFYIIYKKIKQL